MVQVEFKPNQSYPVRFGWFLIMEVNNASNRALEKENETGCFSEISTSQHVNPNLTKFHISDHTYSKFFLSSLPREMSSLLP